ncbi:hypothetical protein Nepgr_001057 [Nepenthes gracilis]|uniref:Uncharacterized protein n=1 Tax=Nepenthes gracilis TaxID=150966 RepID=A0AAD3P4I4_NEPGR|nr:hypothetical protein Nepgr_001057 [Nepenthes gracilis]
MHPKHLSTSKPTACPSRNRDQHSKLINAWATGLQHTPAESEASSRETAMCQQQQYNNRTSHHSEIPYVKQKGKSPSLFNPRSVPIAHAIAPHLHPAASEQSQQTSSSLNARIKFQAKGVTYVRYQSESNTGRTA